MLFELSVYNIVPKHCDLNYNLSATKTQILSDIFLRALQCMQIISSWTSEGGLRCSRNFKNFTWKWEIEISSVSNELEITVSVANKVGSCSRYYLNNIMWRGNLMQFLKKFISEFLIVSYNWHLKLKLKKRCSSLIFADFVSWNLIPQQLPPNYNFEIFKTVWRIKETKSKRGKN